MRTFGSVIALGGLLVLASSCGKEAGRVPFTAEGAREATVMLKAGEVAFWTDLDVEYQGEAAIEYRVELLQAGTNVGSAVCNPLGHLPVKSGWVETNIGSSHSRRGNGKMECSAKVAAGGSTTVKATLAFKQKPQTITLKKADLVVKQ